MHLRTYGKGLQEHEDEEKAEDIWDMITDNWKPNEQYDPYAYVKYFVRLQDMIEHDTIFQKVLDKVKTYMRTFRLPFEKALDKSVNEEKTFIHEAFDSNDELWSSMKQDEMENEDEEELDIFKMYVVYYQSLKGDNVFQGIMDTLNLLIDGRLSYKGSLDFAIHKNIRKIRKAIGKPLPYIPGLIY